MKHIIKKLLRENLLSEVSDDIYEIIRSRYSNGRITMEPRASLNGDKIIYSPVDQPNKPMAKPFGLWYSIGTEWIDWVRMEMPQWERDHAFLLDIDDSRLLKINTYHDLKLFNEEYGIDTYYVDWKRVSEKYGGIEIAPYIYEARHEMLWYYPWDVASGCIWGSNMVKNSKLIQ
jgi:hypothetical protein